MGERHINDANPDQSGDSRDKMLARNAH
jgi:hypothetical protein